MLCAPTSWWVGTGPRRRRSGYHSYHPRSNTTISAASAHRGPLTSSTIRFACDDAWPHACSRQAPKWLKSGCKERRQSCSLRPIDMCELTGLPHDHQRGARGRPGGGIIRPTVGARRLRPSRLFAKTSKSELFVHLLYELLTQLARVKLY